ncbi:hypothetical protein AMATHDRAFT_75949 [Amanita thiersii Skay4041]|uniref:DUF221-domain-containing protein n=1 Tax=Amanita thiersii Skay4041 TaxID=703135 RepID=A0A2A9NKL7_9AGAR|nr:hypothetical protein AMATHDRAFT_75949 [Amanita thiersii Skay4041]
MMMLRSEPFLFRKSGERAHFCQVHNVPASILFAHIYTPPTPSLLFLPSSFPHPTLLSSTDTHPRFHTNSVVASDIQNAKTASKETFVTALVFNAIVFGVELGVFTLIRPYFKAIYEPRTYVPPPSKRCKPLSSNMFLWPWAIFKADHRAIINANGMDAYFFVRFLRMMVKVFLPIWVLSWAVLLPVNHVNTQVAGKDSLDKFSFGNISPDQHPRYAAHLIMAWIFTGWILYNVKKEMQHFIITRQMHLMEPTHARSTQANTVLVTGVPLKYLNKETLYNLYKDLPGGVKKIWINRNLKELPDIYDRRIAACAKLESAETTLLRTAAKLRLQEAKKQAKSSDVEHQALPSESVTDAAAIVPKEQRPQHRLGAIPFFGKKVDTIEWAREEIRVCNELLNEGRRAIEREDEGEEVDISDKHAEGSVEGSEGGRGGITGKGKEVLMKTMKVVRGRPQDSKYPPLNSAFITFNKQIAAHLASQALTHHGPYCMSSKYVEVSPEDVIWGNLGMNPYEQKIRMVVSYSATAALIIFWAFPVAFVGIVSNVHTLCETAPFLAWICTLPPVVVGIISGILPPVMLAILMMLLPIVLRLLARFEGIPNRTGLELSLMSRFFIFQVIHSFLIVTLSSGIIAALDGIVNNPTSIPGLLARNLPQASTFFLTYIILQGLSGTAGGFLQIVRLIIYYVKLVILGSTPRSVYSIKYVPPSVAWGTLFPGITLLVVISIGYSIISPIINGLAFATFFLFYLLYKYLFLWVFQQGTDTGGLFFPKAIQHIFVGLYVEQVCLAALFFLVQNEEKHPIAIPEGALMIVLIIFTAFFHAVINNSYGPLEKSLPLTLTEKMLSGAETSPQEGYHPNRASMVSDSKPLSAESEAGDAPDTANAFATRQETEVEDPEEEAYGFAHPAVSRPQRTIWLPKDAFGLAQEEEKQCREAGVDASVGPDAVMNEKGKVDVSGMPPEIQALSTRT